MEKIWTIKKLVASKCGIQLKSQMVVDSCEIETGTALSISFTDFNTLKGQEVVTKLRNNTLVDFHCSVIVCGPHIEELLPNNNKVFCIRTFFNNFVKPRCSTAQLGSDEFQSKISGKIEAFLTQFLNKWFPDNFFFVWDQSFKLTKLYGSFENTTEFPMRFECAQNAASDFQQMLKSSNFEEMLVRWVKE